MGLFSQRQDFAGSTWCWLRVVSMKKCRISRFTINLEFTAAMIHIVDHVLDTMCGFRIE